MARIYTRTGDRGETSLADGHRISKADLRVETYGTVDELNSWLGLVLVENDQSDIRRVLIRIQSALLNLGSQLATQDPDKRHQMPPIRASQVAQLEHWIDTFGQELEALQVFILPGGHPCAAQLHIARTVCRRAERRLAALLQQDPSLRSELLQYLNRLSDLLFVLARVQNHRHGVAEPCWESHAAE